MLYNKQKHIEKDEKFFENRIDKPCAELYNLYNQTQERKRPFIKNEEELK